jgi:membrane protein YdbS with pleckstrin-like domain
MNKMLTLRIFLFLAINAGLLLLHFSLFNRQPVWGFASAFVHIIVLLVLPYRRIFKY